jgi:hypothetical protein
MEKIDGSKIIKDLKDELLSEYNIKTDRDLMSELGIENDDESKKRIYSWMRLQCAYSYREGFHNGYDVGYHDGEESMN